MEEMKDIEKALRDIAKAIENNDALTGAKVIITVKKQKPSKANKESK